jgi:hypothetical protein
MFPAAAETALSRSDRFGRKIGMLIMKSGMLCPACQAPAGQLRVIGLAFAAGEKGSIYPADRHFPNAEARQ